MAIEDSGTDWMSLLPYAAGGGSALFSVLNLIQQYQRNKQMEELRKYYMDPSQVTNRAQQYWNWLLPAAQSQVSRLAGDAASRGWSGYPRGLAEVTAQAYAPYQQKALEMALGLGGNVQPFVTSPAGPTNPFDAFLRSIMAVKGISDKPTTSGGTKDYSGFYMPEAKSELSLMDTSAANEVP